KPNSEAQLRAGFYGEAWAVYNQWPADYAPTQTQRDVDIDRNRIRDAAKLAWNKAQAKAAKLREEEKYSAAQDVYAAIQQKCHGIPDVESLINKELQATKQEADYAAKRLG